MTDKLVMASVILAWGMIFSEILGLPNYCAIGMFIAIGFYFAERMKNGRQHLS